MVVDLNNINIEGLKKAFRPDEVVKLIVKRHWIVFVYTGLYALFLLLSTGILLYAQDSIFSLFGETFFYLFLIIYWSIYLLFLYIHWINNELDLFIITNRRIRGIEQLSFLDRTISECSLEDVKEVNGKAAWLLASLLNFGTVTMHTASEKSDFIMEFAPNPLETASTILSVIQENKPRHPQND